MIGDDIFDYGFDFKNVLKESIAAKKAREKKMTQYIEEARARVYEKHKSYPYEELILNKKKELYLFKTI